MNVKTIALIATGLTGLIAFTGCSAATADEPTGEFHGEHQYVAPNWKPSDGPVTFSCTGTQANYAFTLPAAGDEHPTAQKVEKFRTMIDAPEVDYIAVDVDATHAAPGYVGVWKLSFATAEGISVDAEDPGATIEDWREPYAPGSEVYEATYSAYGKASEAHYEETQINGGGKGQRVFISKVPVTSMVAPTIYENAASQAPCYPVDPAYLPN